MKKKSRFFLVRVLICALCGSFAACTDPKEPQQQEQITPTEAATRSVEKAWDYPVKPGSDAWRQLKTFDQLFEACQIPEGVLKTLDTESLVNICFDYPLYSALNFYNSPQAGFEILCRNFNGLRELMDRKDIGVWMLEKYKSLSVNKDFNPLWTSANRGRYVLHSEYFDIMMSQPQIVRSLDGKQRLELIREAIRKFDEKRSRNDLFRGYSLMLNSWVMARALHYESALISDRHKPEEIEKSLESGHLVDYDISSIYEQAKAYSHE